MLRIENLSRFYGDFTAVDDLNIHLEKGKFLTILGPSGSGKTTTLLAVAGFVIPDKGKIYVANQDITNILAHKRNIGMVFQNYALFPHMTTLQNVTYPLKMRKMAKVDCDKKAREYLKIVGLEGFERRYPKELSGGQQQRVALARALVYDPPILLMDEPLGALDKQLRQRMQLEIKHIQRQLDITVIYVTHDQEEALTMSDEIIIINHGRIEQQGAPWQLYESPSNKFVAEFMGESNLLQATVVRSPADGQSGEAVLSNNSKIAIMTEKQLKVGDEIFVSVRPESVSVSDEPGEGAHESKIMEIIYLGESTRYRVQLTNGGPTVISKQSKVLFSSLEKLQNKALVYVNWDKSSGIVLTK